MLILTIVVWTLYPATWLLAEFNCISPAFEQFLISLQDYMAKVWEPMHVLCVYEGA